MIPLLQRNASYAPAASRDRDDDDIPVNGGNNNQQEVDIENNNGNNNNALPNGRAFNFTMEQEQVRRQQILRMGIIICALFFFMDQTNYNSNKPPETHYISNKTCGSPLEEICLSSSELQAAQNVLLPFRTSDSLISRNVTGLYKGDWRSIMPDGNLSTFSAGSLILQTKTIPIHNLPDLSFTYGLMRVYTPQLRYIPELSFTMQGVILTAQRKLLMFSTPYKTQKLMLQFYGQTSPSSTDSSSYKTVVDPSHFNHHANVLYQFNSQNLGSLPYSGNLGRGLGLNIFIYDSALGAANTTFWNSNSTYTFSPSEGSLSARFKMYQKTRMIAPTVKSSSKNASVVEEPELFVFDLDISEKSVKMNRRLSTTTSSASFDDNSNHDSHSNNNNGNNHDQRERRSLVGEVGSSSPIAQGVSGSVQCYFNCPHNTPSIPSTSFHLSLSSYETQLDTLTQKVEIYSLLYTAVCLAQILLTITQIRSSSTQSANSKIAIFSLLGQSVLDAVICMVHLGLATSLQNIFFASFLWISVLKLLLFAVFQMRMIINAYQARYAQEIAQEGWRGLRTRLVALHLRFYFVVVFILILGATFPFSPWIAVICLYSFWWPQIVHSVYQGTRHPLHPVYLLGISFTRLFLPLYIIGCPKNFFVELIKYYSASGELPPDSTLLSLSACYFLVIWQCLQIGILFMQTAFGPRFFIPKRFLPGRYDYHRPLPSSIAPVSTTYHRSSGNNNRDVDDSYGDIETGSLLQSTRNNDSSTSGGDGTGEGEEGGLECVICYNAIHLHLQHQYMITPCDHVFHEECLVRWLAVKLECPVCRAALPPHEDGDNDDDD